MPALSRGLGDPNVQIRRNVALFLGVTSGGWFTFDPPQQRLDIHDALPALTTALGDDDSRVRGLAAQAIGNIGPSAVNAVPALVTLLASTDEGSRNSACIGLYGIGPAAREALPALRKALTDPSTDVRRFAQRTIDKIDAPR
jgi:HEAT repeat protein